MYKLFFFFFSVGNQQGQEHQYIFVGDSSTVTLFSSVQPLLANLQTSIPVMYIPSEGGLWTSDDKLLWIYEHIY